MKCLDVPQASQALADHGRNAHRLADQWRLECKKAKELGQKPPLPPQEQKRLEARKAKREATERGEAMEKGGKSGAGSKDGATGREVVETDSSEEERNAVEVAEEQEKDATSSSHLAVDGVSAEQQMLNVRAEDTNAARPSFLAV